MLLCRRARRGDCGMVIGEIDRLNQNVSQLLRYAKQARDVDSPCDLEAVVKRVLVLSRAEAERLGVKLECSVTCASAQVEGGEEAATDIVSNLVVNALEATPRGGKVTVRLVSGGLPGWSRGARGGRRGARRRARPAREDISALLYHPAGRDGPGLGHRKAAGGRDRRQRGVRQPVGRKRRRALCGEIPCRRFPRLELGLPSSLRMGRGWWRADQPPLAPP